jgi:uncharacterized protein with gpF-like domain
VKRRPLPPGTLMPVRPSAAIEDLYAKRLQNLIDEMHASLLWWIGATYKAKPPEMAQDKSPAATLQEAIEKLRRRWEKRFDEAAPRLAKWFALSVMRRSDRALEEILREAGLSVRFQMPRAANDVLQATTAENVSLIKSIASQHLTQVEGLVMRSVQAGRDVGGLAKELEARYAITRRRAELISRTENNKATAMIQRVRQQSVGITHAVWVHSRGSTHKRPSHVQAGADKVVFDVSEGWLDPAINKRIWPGTEINCKCFSRPVLPKAKTT